DNGLCSKRLAGLERAPQAVQKDRKGTSGKVHRDEDQLPAAWQERGRNGGPTINWLDWRSMRFDLITIFPEFFTGPLDHGILRRARETGLVEVNVKDLRVFTKDRHRTVDDRPFGGGEGMVLKPEPVFEAVESLLGCRAGEASRPSAADPKTAIVLMSAAGKLFGQETARRYAQLERIILICGRYEGVDERVAEHLATEELSIGDFVLSGGELPAVLVIDAVTRLLPGPWGTKLLRRMNPSAGWLIQNRRRFIPGAARVPRHESGVPVFWIFRTTRGRRSIEVGPCRRFSSGETTRKWPNGGAAPRSKKPSAIAPICCPRNKMELPEVLIQLQTSYSTAAGPCCSEREQTPRMSTKREDS